ncbi:guanine nucleotide exchange factor DBS-like isoform X4 [Palaemon carinicauda]|uniref:guanine nucleotide exchange factor DBS-like isoform X4 n=1 Tax=Palaemon carinicauda TaxID=392227 RepID=UPI0035B5FFC7
MMPLPRANLSLRKAGCVGESEVESPGVALLGNRERTGPSVVKEKHQFSLANGESLSATYNGTYDGNANLFKEQMIFTGPEILITKVLSGAFHRSTSKLHLGGSPDISHRFKKPWKGPPDGVQRRRHSAIEPETQDSEFMAETPETAMSEGGDSDGNDLEIENSSGSSWPKAEDNRGISSTPQTVSPSLSPDDRYWNRDDGGVGGHEWAWVEARWLGFRRLRRQIPPALEERLHKMKAKEWGRGRLRGLEEKVKGLHLGLGSWRGSRSAKNTNNMCRSCSLTLNEDCQDQEPSSPDEVLEEGGCALSVRDVSELLHAQYAIITGGKSREGCPILTFPDRGNFAQLGDEEYRKLIIYLTSVPSLQDADMGFVLVIDRRNDKWNSVKTVLLKISGFFPGLITVAYVLRPAGFLQKAISEVSNKIFRDEFKFRVVVCNCVGDLHEYIDRNQLTEDLDGCIPYNHDEWIEQRVRRPGYHRFYNEQLFSRQIQHAVATLKQAVEKFSANTQEISASLRAFTQKLQETEFPNDVTSTEELLNSQCSEYSVLKDDLLSASRHGETLLNCIKRPGEPRTARLCPDKLINVTAVERLLVQLEETERTFDEFWTRHEGRLTQCLQLRRFETDFRELQTCLEESLKQLSGMSEVGDSVVHVDQLLAEAQDFHMICADQLEKAEELRIIGMQLIESQHYAVDSIQPKCVELVRMRDAFHDRITTRLETLHKCRDLQERIERANKWCTEGVELLASQQIERCQAPEFAEEALRELEEFMASSDHSRLGSSHELRSIFEEFITPETKGLVQQVLKRIEDVQMMCEKRKSSLKKLATRLPRPVHAVTPEPAVPLHYPQGHSNVHPHSHPASPLHADSPKSPKSIRKASTLPKLGDSSDSPDWVGDAEAARAKRGHVLKELLDTERVYVSELCSILKGYKDEMLNPEMQPLIPVNLYGKSDLLFGNMEEIFRFHNDVFLRDLENCINTPELIGLCFVQRKDSFHRLYSLYCQNKPQSEELRRQVGDHNPFFKECQRRLHHKLPLGAYLLKPVQRITKYQLLLKDLLKCVEGSQGRRELQEAVDTMLTVLKCLNDSMHQVAITGFPGNLADLGKLLMQGPFSVWNESKKGLRELRLKPAQRHIFLYEKVLLFTKRAGKDTDRATYHFKNALKMSQVGLTESIRGHKGDIRKFEVWLQGRQEVHIILAPSVEVKETWVKEIKRVLLDQFEYLKGENIKQYSSRIQKGASLNGIRIPPLSPTTQHRALRQTASWDMAGNGMSGSGGSISSSSSEGRTGEGGRENSRRSMRGMRSAEGALDAPEEEEESWSSDYSASDEEEDQETFSESTEYTSSRFLVLADYNAMGGSEVSLREGDYVDLIKVGCAGWWYVRVSGTPYEGWAPAAYLERVLKKGSRSSPSVSSQESSSGLKHATSRARKDSMNKWNSKGLTISCKF